MGDLEHAWLDLERRDPRVLGEAARHQVRNPLHHVVRRVRGHAELRSSDDDVRLDLPAVTRPVDRRRSILRIAFGRAARRPTSRLSRCPAAKAIGRWRTDRARDRRTTAASAGSRPCVFIARAHGRASRIGHERHRRHLARPMARLTILLKDGEDLLAERHGVVGGRRPALCRGDGHDPTRQAAKAYRVMAILPGRSHTLARPLPQRVLARKPFYSARPHYAPFEIDTQYPAFKNTPRCGDQCHPPRRSDRRIRRPRDASAPLRPELVTGRAPIRRSKRSVDYIHPPRTLDARHVFVRHTDREVCGPPDHEDARPHLVELVSSEIPGGEARTEVVTPSGGSSVIGVGTALVPDFRACVCRPGKAGRLIRR